jgi:8-oxo-dGTP diphosphatase
MLVELLPLDSIPDSSLAYAVVGARHGGKWIFVRHRDRSTWEMPGGHREPAEPIDATARRELYEETGSQASLLRVVCEYSVLRGSDLSFGRLYYAVVRTVGPLPGFEIVETMVGNHPPGALTYPDIQPVLMERLGSL